MVFFWAGWGYVQWRWVVRERSWGGRGGIYHPMSPVVVAGGSGDGSFHLIKIKNWLSTCRGPCLLELFVMSLCVLDIMS